MREIFKNLLYRFYYGLVLIASLVYHIFFVGSPLPGFWEKVFILLSGLIIIVLYFFSSTLTKSKLTEMKLSAVNPAINALLFIIGITIAHYFILLIFFGKNPPVTVGIPYSVFSFTISKILVTGLIYNYVFYLTLMFILNYFKKKY